MKNVDFDLQEGVNPDSAKDSPRDEIPLECLQAMEKPSLAGRFILGNPGSRPSQGHVLEDNLLEDGRIA